MKELRIMHGLSEVAGQGCYSVSGLKALGEKAKMVVWTPNKFSYPYDISLNIDRNKKLLFPIYAIKMLFFFLYSLLKFNVYHFHYGRSFLLCKDLGVLKLLHKEVYFEFHGSDLRNNAIANVRNPYFNIDVNENIQTNLDRKNKKICDMADGIIIHDHELKAYLPENAKRIFYVPLRLDVNAFIPEYPSLDNERITIVHAPSNPQLKGTEYIIKAIDKLKEKYSIDFILIQNKTQDEAKKLYQKADIIVDQLLIGTYGVFALEGMALGKPVITYIMNDMLQTFPSELPIQSANIDNIEQVLEKLIVSPEYRYKIGVAGRKYVEDYHDYKKVAAYLKRIYSGNQLPVSSREAFSNVKNIFKE